MKTTVLLSMIVAIILFGGAVMVIRDRSISRTPVNGVASNVRVLNGKQIIDIRAKGGYSPSITNAKANMPTVIKMNTQGTFDCSSAFTIPSLGIRVNLPPSGSKEIEIPAQQAGTTVQGLCAMGMYNFALQFN